MHPLSFFDLFLFLGESRSVTYSMTVDVLMLCICATGMQQLGNKKTKRQLDLSCNVPLDAS